MTDAIEIDWDAVVEPAANVTMTLAEVPLDETHAVTFVALTPLPENLLVADVSSETLEGNALWLRGQFGPQNGLHSLVKAAEGGENIVGKTFNITRVASEKSPAGYAYRWTA